MAGCSGLCPQVLCPQAHWGNACKALPYFTASRGLTLADRIEGKLLCEHSRLCRMWSWATWPCFRHPLLPQECARPQQTIPECTLSTRAALSRGGACTGQNTLLSTTHTALFVLFPVSHSPPGPPLSLFLGASSSPAICLSGMNFFYLCPIGLRRPFHYHFYIVLSLCICSSFSPAGH